MSYTKTTWVNNSVPRINATNLNKIEQGIYDLDALINTPNYYTANITADGYDYTVTTSAITAYSTGMTLKCKFNKSNFSDATININNLGAKSLKINGSISLDYNLIVPNRYFTLMYDGTYFQILELQGAICNIKKGLNNNYIYVNGSTGSDSTGDGTSNYPYRGVSRALASLQKYTGSSGVTLNCSNCNDSGFTISGFVIASSYLSINFTNCTFSDLIYIDSNTGMIWISGGTYTNSSGSAFLLRNNNHVRIQGATITTSAQYAGVNCEEGNSFVEVSTSAISNRSVAISCYISNVISLANSGTGNGTGLFCQSGTIMKSGGQPSGTTAESATSGGIIR